MPLPPGARLGPYEIVGAIGAGGMGEVYRARDVKLARDVAIKVLPQLFAADADRVARFEREAQTLAALNHPNIAQIFGLVELQTGRGSGSPGQALVMEFVDGEDLAQRIARGAIPVGEALAIARQIAAALEAAHDRGIIHRDLKPANVMLRGDDTVKILDFGLAKALEPAVAGADAAHSPTFTSPVGVTQAGFIIGTAAYMAPEQAKGRPIGKRADIWAFGCLLFEMLSGRAPFSGDGVTEILAKVIEREPEWSALPATTPASVRRLIRRCLQKDPKRRLADVADARLELDDADAGEERQTGAPMAQWRTRAPWIVAAVLAGVAVLAAWQWRRAAAATADIPRATYIAATLAIDRANLRSLADRFAVSPDGSRLVFVDDTRGLMMRQLSSLDVSRLAGAPDTAFAPVFSPDGKWIAFSTDGELMKIPSEGGKPTLLASGTDYFLNLSWDGDGRIRFPALKFDAIRSVSENGGPVETIAMAPETWVNRATSVGNGRLLLSLLSNGERRIAIREANGTLRTIADGWDARLTPSGHLLFARREGTVWSLAAARFDTSRGTLVGESAVIARDVPVHFSTLAGASASGDVFYVSGATRSDRRIVVVDRSGGEREMPVAPAAWVSGNLSPDGTRLALARWEGARRTLWTIALDTAALTQVTYVDDTFAPYWMADGKRLALTYFPIDPRHRSTSVWSVLADGRGQIEPVPIEWDAYPGPSSADGQTLFYTVWQTAEGQSDIRSIALGRAGAKPVILIATPADEDKPTPSPDGGWLAYETTASGTREVRVASLGEAATPVQVSTRGGSPVRWSSDSKTLYYLDGQSISAVDVTAAGPALASRRAVFSVPRDPRGSVDVTPDGQRAVMIRGGLIYSDIAVAQRALQ